MKDVGKLPPLAIRMPEDLKRWLREQAVVNRRSLNGELLYRLEQSRQVQAIPQGGAQ